MPTLEQVTLEQVAERHERFFQQRVRPERRALAGLHGWLHQRFPLRRPDGRLTLEYLGYRLEEPPLSLAVCQDLGCDLRAPLWLTLRLVRWREGAIEEVLEQEVGLGAVPALTGEGAVHVPELAPASWDALEAAVLAELAEALAHAEAHLGRLDVDAAGQPWDVLHGG